MAIILTALRDCPTLILLCFGDVTCARCVHDISENDAAYTSMVEPKDGCKTVHRIRTYTKKSASRHKPNQSMFFKTQSVICDAEKNSDKFQVSNSSFGYRTAMNIAQ